MLVTPLLHFPVTYWLSPRHVNIFGQSRRLPRDIASLIFYFIDNGNRLFSVMIMTSISFLHKKKKSFIPCLVYEWIQPHCICHLDEFCRSLITRFYCLLKTLSSTPNRFFYSKIFIYGCLHFLVYSDMWSSLISCVINKIIFQVFCLNLTFITSSAC